MDEEDLNENRFHALIGISAGAYLAFICGRVPSLRALFRDVSPFMLIFVGLGVIALTYWNAVRDDEAH